MKKYICLSAILILISACSEGTTVLPNNKGTVVDFKDDASNSDIQELATDLGIVLRPNSKMFNRDKVTIFDGILSQNINDSLFESGLVEGVELNIIMSVLPGEIQTRGINDNYVTEGILPNDPLYVEGKQWNFDMIDMPSVWKSEALLGNEVIVAVLDTGVSDGKGTLKRMPDLKQTCILEGYSFVDDNTDAYDSFGHGTHVAGTIAQSTNNGIGVTGIAPNACIFPVKVLNDDGGGSVADIADGVYLAMDAGAKVINLSLGSNMNSKLLATAIKAAADAGVFVACAAGNDAKDILIYPAGNEGCHAISAVGPKKVLSSYSSYGKSKEGQTIFMTAPGGEMRDGMDAGIWQDTVDPEDPTKHGYFPYQGTSMATPHVAGVAALVIANYEVATLQDIEAVLTITAEDLADSNKYGAGLVNAGAAMAEASRLNNDNKNKNKNRMYDVAILIASILASAAIIKQSTEEIDE